MALVVHSTMHRAGRTDPVGRCGSLQLRQFRGVHRRVCFSRGSGAGREDDAAGFIEFWMVGRRALVDGQELRFRRKHNQIKRDTGGAADHILSTSSCFILATKRPTKDYHVIELKDTVLYQTCRCGRCGMLSLSRLLLVI